VFRLTLVAAAALLCLPLSAAEPQPAPKPLPFSIIHYAQDATALDHFEENPAVTRRMVDRLVRAVT